MHLSLGLGLAIAGFGGRLGLCRLRYSHVDGVLGSSRDAFAIVGGQRRHL